ncbi:SURF1 family cytochrome oxidase biogenesis protein [Streptomyces sp. NPDC005438]|uniref:SURF1 family cytochrome oxidase biogenesis protein n=1 Tax=Streptomyces sp. NPDC005438 TaxID=3156880 RepID=UPI0033B6C5EB
MYRFLLTRQWVILTLVGLALIPAMVRLGFWQLHRHEARVAHNDQIAAALDRATVPVDRLTGVGREVPGRDRYRSVRASGTFDTAHEVVVRQRTAADESSIGYFVLTPLRQSDGSRLLVNRGWIPAGDDLTRFPDVPAAPRGEVTVTGRLMPDETTASSGIKDREGLPSRQVMLMNSRQLAREVSGPVLGGYVQLTDLSPKPSGRQPELVPSPDHDSIGPHMAYAVQWWLFAAGVPVGWVVLVRRERRDRAEGRVTGTSDGTSSTSGTATGPGTGPGAGPEGDPGPAKGGSPGGSTDAGSGTTTGPHEEGGTPGDAPEDVDKDADGAPAGETPTDSELGAHS